MIVIHAQLITYRNDFGDYTIYVFKNLEDNTFEMMTRLPRWEAPIINIGDTGFVKFKEVLAGKDTWYDKNTGKEVPYYYDGIYFIDFVLDKNIEQDEIIL